MNIFERISEQKMITLYSKSFSHERKLLLGFWICLRGFDFRVSRAGAILRCFIFQFKRRNVHVTFNCSWCFTKRLIDGYLTLFVLIYLIRLRRFFYRTPKVRSAALSGSFFRIINNSRSSFLERVILQKQRPELRFDWWRVQKIRVLTF